MTHDKLTVRLRWSPETVVEVGQLAGADRRIYFEYSSDFPGRGLHLSPFKLPIRSGLIEHTDRAFGPLFGLFDDALPDGWGRLLMDRMFRRRGLEPAAVSPLDRLSYVGTRAMGALTFHPAAELPESDPRLFDLHELGKNARDVLAGSQAVVLPQLMRAGGSPGGARPKVLVGVDGDRIVSGEDDLPAGFDPWLIKFAADADGPDAGPVEYAYAEMARLAGIDVPETRLFRATKTKAYFGVRRFDRGPGNRRMHVHTFGNLIQTNFRIPSTDYVQLMQVTSALTKKRPDLLRAFRLMVFNIAAHNRDDHAKNFSFIMDPAGDWRLSPAYDLSHSPGPGGEHSTTIAGEGRAPRREHVLQVAARVGVDAKEAVAMIEQINTAVAEWKKVAEQAGCSKKRTNRIAGEHVNL